MIPPPDSSCPAEWPSSGTSRVVSLKGRAGEEAAVHYLDFGGPADASVLLCVHGLGGSSLNFGLLGPALADTHRVLALDLFAHGRSSLGTAPPGDFREAVADQVRLISQFIQQVAGSQVVFVGHSLGGVLSLLHALSAPSDVARLVLLGPPVPHAGAGRRDLRLMAKLLLLRTPGVRRAVARTVQSSTPESLVERQLNDATPHAAAIDPSAVAASITETRLRAQRTDAKVAQRQQWDAILGTIALLAAADEWHHRLDALRPPTLWLHGEDDLLSPASDALSFLARHPDWTAQTRSGVGHLPHLEDPAWTALAISEWLTTTD